MPAFRVVEVLDVVGNGVVRLGPRCEDVAVHEFLLQGREEALGDGVVVAVADAAHALPEAVLSEHLAVPTARVLAPAVGVMHEAPHVTAGTKGAPQSAQSQLARERST